MLQAVGTRQLLSLPSLLTVELCNLSQLMSDVSEAICIARFGYRLFGYIIKQQKIATCDYLSKEGLLVLPHNSPYVFCKGSTIVGLHQLVRGLMAARVDHLILSGYGMKLPLQDFISLSTIA